MEVTPLAPIPASLLDTRPLQRVALEGLRRMLNEPAFTPNNPKHLAAAQSLWHGALLARLP